MDIPEESSDYDYVLFYEHGAYSAARSECSFLIFLFLSKSTLCAFTLLFLVATFVIS